MKEPIRCARCVMDNSSDETIVFDAEGVCNYCTQAYSEMQTTYFPNEIGQAKLTQMLEEVKSYGKGKPYDCIMGLSGGLDSSYLAYLGHLWGLKVLAVHVDDGFDTEISKQNLRKLVKKTGFDYRAIKPDEKQFNALTKAYFNAGVPNAAVPQDNVLFAFLYKCARKYNIKYFLSGTNFALECILQQGNTHSAYDLVNLKDINSKCGTESIDNLETISILQRVIDQYVRGIKTIKPLNYINYNRERAFKELEDFCDFQYYGRKHLENSLTEFIQLYWFPHKFGVDKRTSHLSSMIVSGQMTREEALKELEKPLYDKGQMVECINLIKSKIGISDEEFEQIMSAPSRQHTDYKTQDDLLYIKLLKKIRHLL